MSAYKKYVHAFQTTMGIDDKDKLEGLKYQDVEAWDSVGHMELVSELEDAFDIEMETDDIIDFNSFEKGITILNEKYDVGIEKE